MSTRLARLGEAAWGIASLGGMQSRQAPTPRRSPFQIVPARGPRAAWLAGFKKRSVRDLAFGGGDRLRNHRLAASPGYVHELSWFRTDAGASPCREV